MPLTWPGPETSSFACHSLQDAEAHDGAHAEYVAVPPSDVAIKPQSLDYVHAAAIPHGSLTAWQALFELAHLSGGQSILTHGAAGGVGHIAVQLAKLFGAKVIGVASHNIAFLRELRVDQAIDYSSTRSVCEWQPETAPENKRTGINLIPVL